MYFGNTFLLRNTCRTTLIGTRTVEDYLVAEFDIAAELFDVCVPSLDIFIRSLIQHGFEVTLRRISVKLLVDPNLMLNLLMRRHIMHSGSLALLLRSLVGRLQFH